MYHNAQWIVTKTSYQNICFGIAAWGPSVGRSAWADNMGDFLEFLLRSLSEPKSPRLKDILWSRHPRITLKGNSHYRPRVVDVDARHSFRQVSLSLSRRIAVGGSFWMQARTAKSPSDEKTRIDQPESATAQPDIPDPASDEAIELLNEVIEVAEEDLTVGGSGPYSGPADPPTTTFTAINEPAAAGAASSSKAGAGKRKRPSYPAEDAEESLEEDWGVIRIDWSWRQDTLFSCQCRTIATIVGRARKGPRHVMARAPVVPAPLGDKPTTVGVPVEEPSSPIPHNNNRID
ncbi:hypothetical protein MBM_03513 [Drepanopeziza brunnea f. sp. 'multigermtubi' MB_m1]|uniref:Uncharacterized protein n=1 Tax=Marssonina brunnea f. sp. multigermtubi (strain MB_m1) TaxID=1072389 RepID=K1WLC6_MARBU|nr:uncharacterized protein MBM_03513 [Drepanopeziza brunnea f. sp. 'multigermtubi' MB_m1]EKD18520.1 hypothetical protein MBM_03513 [Drepanopeziza brunnea f. sp. 'multigermtubi' MB_m1]